ncbi:MAG: FG-GAP-like repeat-containing protein [Isosphaeraceae bacterium]
MRRLSHPPKASNRPGRRSRRPAPGPRRFYFRPSLGFGRLEDRTLLATFLVNTTADSGPGSLRQAILDANAAPGRDTIEFALPGPADLISGGWTIAPASALPAVTEAALIDGWSQSGQGDSNRPLVRLDGSSAGPVDGLTLNGSEIEVRGLSIGGFAGAGVLIVGEGAVNNWIHDNIIGSDPSIPFSVGNGLGVRIVDGARDNLIGTDGPGGGNVIRGNSAYFDVQFMPWGNGDDVPYENPGDRPLIIAGLDDAGLLHVRTYDRTGTFLETYERMADGTTYLATTNALGASPAGTLEDSPVSGLTLARSQALAALKRRLQGWAPGQQLSDAEKAQVLGEVRLLRPRREESGGILVQNPLLDYSLGFPEDPVALSRNGNSGAYSAPGTEDGSLRTRWSGASSVFTREPVAINRFSTSFLFQADDFALGNGFTFAIQRVGPKAIERGFRSRSLGQEGIPSSAAISFAYRNSDTSKPASLTGLFLNGERVTPGRSTDLLGEGIDFSKGSRAFRTDIQYADARLVVTITDTRTGASATQRYDINLPAVVGGDTAYVGFTTRLGDLKFLAWEYRTSTSSTTGNRLIGNVIEANGGPAIDLGVDGLQPLSPGPNLLQPAPVIVATASGYRGWLPNAKAGATYRVDVYASAGFGPGGAGEAARSLGTFDVSAAADGDLTFDVPFDAPDGLPVLSATATGPGGDTSGLTRQRTLRLALFPARPLRSSASGTKLGGATGLTSLADPGAGPIEPTATLRLVVGAGTLSVTPRNALGPTGQGTARGARGPVTVLAAALADVTHAAVRARWGGSNSGARVEIAGPPAEAMSVLTDGRFVVTSAADAGLGSFRQALLDSNAAPGGLNTVVFALAGAGPHRLTPASPWPAVINPTLIDGTDQAGPPGTPAVTLGGGGAGGGLGVSGADVLLLGVAVAAFDLGDPGRPSTLVLGSGPTAVGPAPLGTTYQVTTTTQGRLTVALGSIGASGRVRLRDAGGATVATSDGAAVGSGNWIDIHLPPGTYALDVSLAAGGGPFRLTAAVFPAQSALAASQVGFSASLVTVADFNNDGRPDVLSNLTGGLAVFLNNGDGSLRPGDAVEVGRSTWLVQSVVTTADFDGDGRVDLAVTNTLDDTVSVLLGRGDGTFAPRLDLAAGVAPSGLTAADFDGDGRLDLSCAHAEDQTVSVWLGNGDGTFRPRVNFDAGRTQTRLASADFNGDGRADLVVWREWLSNGQTDDSPWRGVVSVLLGNGDGSFQSRSDFALGDGVLATVVGDFDGDGRPDVAATASDFDNQNLNYRLAVIAGKGDGAFRPPIDWANRNLGQLEDIQAGDFDGDGRLDLAVAGLGTVAVFSGRGEGTSRGRTDFSLSTALMTAGDFDGDGRLDLVATAGENEGGSLRVLLGNGDGSFRPRDDSARLPAGMSASSFLPVDFNGDGWTDLVALAGVNNSGRLLTYLGTGAGSFQLRATLSIEGSFGTGTVADFNGDGRPDVAVTNSDTLVHVLLGNGDGTFQPPASFATGKGNWGVVVGDFDGDGRLDLATTNLYDKENSVSILLGKGDGTFRPALGVNAGRAQERLTAGDFNGDGRLDLAVPNLDVATVSVLLGKGDGTFQPRVVYAATNFPNTVTAADFNNDGATDLVVVNQNVDSVNYGDDTVSVLLGNGDGTFRPRVDYPVTRSASSFTVGDFNGDGFPDLVAPDPSQGWDDALGGNDPGGLSVLIGNGDGTFQPRKNTPFSEWTSRLAVADFNNDGRADVVTNGLTVLLGKGDGSFSSRSDILAAAQLVPLSVDLDRDGATDVLTLDSSGRILFRRGIPGQPGTFLPPMQVGPENPFLGMVVVPDASGPLLATVDSGRDAVSLHAFRDGALRPIATLTTGRLPAQVVQGDLDGDGFADLVVRNAVDGSVSVFFDNRSSISGPLIKALPPAYMPAQTLDVGPGVSDVKAVDLDGDGRLELVAVSQTGSQLLVLNNRGGRRFDAPAPYRSGTGPNWVDAGRVRGWTTRRRSPRPGSRPAGRRRSWPPTPGPTRSACSRGSAAGGSRTPPRCRRRPRHAPSRSADLDGDGLSDLVVLDDRGLAVALADGRGGFGPFARYDAGLDPTGVSVADVDADGVLDLLAGNAHGDVLVLLGDGGGGFRAFRKTDQSVALAVADLDGDGRAEFVYANPERDRVVVDFGRDDAAVLADRSRGLLSPGAVRLVDMNGDSLPDLIVANSGSNNVLVYPGLGGGRFGPAANGNGFFVGTNPTGLDVKDLNGDGRPDMVVANTGSNDVSILLGQGAGDSWTMARGPRIKTYAGPSAVVVGDVLGTGKLDLAVANRQANNVQVFPGLGGGFFNDQSPQRYDVGQAPGGLFLGNFGGQGNGLAVLNGGSNDISLIGQDGSVRSFASGGLRPAAGFAGDFNGDGLADLVVGNGGSGTFSLFLGGARGLSLSQTAASPAVPSPTSLSFAGVNGGVLSFYAATAGREAASLLAFDLNVRNSTGEGSPIGPIGPGPSETDSTPAAGLATFRQVSQLAGAGGSVFALIASLLTVTAVPGSDDAEESAGRGTDLVANFLPANAAGQSADAEEASGSGGGDEPGTASGEGEPPAASPSEDLPPWEELAMGLEEAWEAARAELLGEELARLPQARENERVASAPPVASHAGVLDVAIESLDAEASVSREIATDPVVPSWAPTFSESACGAMVGVAATVVAGERWFRRRRGRRPLDAGLARSW